MGKYRACQRQVRLKYTLTGLNQKTIGWDGPGKLGAFVRFFPLNLLSASLLVAVTAWLAKLEYFLL